jgi:hypothetical protein
MQNEPNAKVARIIASLRPLFNRYGIRFPVLDPKRDMDGRLHVPAANSSRLYWRLLYDQLDTFTDDGASDHDDGPDALQMLLRLLDKRKGRNPEPLNDNEVQDLEWQKVGVNFSRFMLPEACWTERMRREHEEESRVQVMSLPESDPYD